MKKTDKTTNKVRQNYEQGGQKSEIFNVKGLISLIQNKIKKKQEGRSVSFPLNFHPFDYYSSPPMFPFNVFNLGLEFGF